MGKIPIQFLLAFTEPSSHGSTSLLVATNEPENERNGIQLSKGQDESSNNLDYYNMLFWDHEDWTFNFQYVLSRESDAGSSDHDHLLLQEIEANNAQELRLKDIVLQLTLMHDCMYETGFDLLMAQDVFTASNMKEFVATYFEQLADYYPIIHRPSFDCTRVSLPLLLSIFLFGSLCSVPQDAALSTRQFFDVSEEYIFNALRELTRDGKRIPDSDEELQILQAAFIMNIIQNGTNNETTRRRVRIHRHPSLVSSLRSSDILTAKRQEYSTLQENNELKWHRFIHEEIRIR